MSSWFKRDKQNVQSQTKKDVPEGVWVKCPACSAVIYSRKLERNFHVCSECGHHMRLPADDYIRLLADEGSYSEFNAEMHSADPLEFKDSKRYIDRISAAEKKTGRKEAVRTGEASIEGLPVVLAVMDFQFLGGSVGSVVGEKIARAIDHALVEKRSLIIVSCSGGMRMQEGMLSLMQMAKTSARLTRLADAGLPYISLLADPTTGGTTASFSMLGDLNISEPGALIGFAGPRVIKQTIGQDLPEGFQRSEFVQSTGFLDQVIPRLQLRSRIAHFLSWMTGQQSDPELLSIAAAEHSGTGEHEQ